MITADFCYGYLSFSPRGVALSLPGGFSLDLLRYWDGQSIYFVCCERGLAEDEAGQGKKLGRVFWCVAIEVLEGEAEENEKGEDGDKRAGDSKDDMGHDDDVD